MLTLIPTPIGNLEDITLRALRILRESDLIACEDTRTSRILLDKYNIHTKLVSFHLHNENLKVETLLQELRSGKNICVISDAGTPGISDPGWILLKRALEENLDVDVLPGASALIPGILLSGLSPQPFVFLGFPPEKFSERVRLFAMLAIGQGSKVSIQKQISEMREIFGERSCALVREISKLHQEAIRGNFSEILSRLAEGLKGEFVLVVDGCKNNLDNPDDSWQSEAENLLRDGDSVKNIAELLSGKFGVKKNLVKKFLLQKNEPLEGLTS